MASNNNETRSMGDDQTIGLESQFTASVLAGLDFVASVVGDRSDEGDIEEGGVSSSGDGAAVVGDAPLQRRQDVQVNPPPPTGEEEGMVAGDAVAPKAVIDVDDLMEDEKEAEAEQRQELQQESSRAVFRVPPAVARAPAARSVNQEDFDCVSEITYDMTATVADEMGMAGYMGDGKPSAGKGKGEVPLAHYHDMDDDGANPKGQYQMNTPSVASAPLRETTTNVARRQQQNLGNQVSDWLSTVPEPEPLEGTPPGRRMAPGAFAVSPPRRDARSDEPSVADDGTVQILSNSTEVDVDDCAVSSFTPGGVDTEAATNRISHTRAPSRAASERMLIEATLVEDGDAVDPSMLQSRDFSDGGSHSGSSIDQETATNHNNNSSNSNAGIFLVEAKPLGSPRSFQELIRSRWTQFNILLVIVLVSVAIGLGVLAIKQGGPSTSASSASAGGDNNSTEPPLLTPAPSPLQPSRTASPTLQTTVAPSVPAAAPLEESIEPTALSIMMDNVTREDLFERLPEYTREAMKWTGSPQFRAFTWLRNDPYLPTYTVERMMQRFALVTVLMSIGIEEHMMDETQMYGVHECNWSTLNLPCDDKKTKLCGVEFSGAGLKGTIPPEVGLLTALEKFDVSQNVLTGSIPDTIGRLSGLRVLGLYQNELTGTLPNTISTMSFLENLDLRKNKFSATVPLEVGFLTNLKYLRLSTNRFTGAIPGTLRHLSMLERLHLNHNQMSSSLPDVLSQLTTTETMLLNSNFFTGTIPESLGDLSVLQQLILSDNQLTGTVPASLGTLYSVSELQLQGNSLEGTLPLEVCALREWFELEEIAVDCDEITCHCLCVCFSDQPTGEQRTQEDEEGDDQF